MRLRGLLRREGARDPERDDALLRLPPQAVEFLLLPDIAHDEDRVEGDAALRVAAVPAQGRDLAAVTDRRNDQIVEEGGVDDSVGNTKTPDPTNSSVSTISQRMWRR